MVNLPTLSTFHFVNSHFVNSRFVNIDQVGIDKIGIDKVGITLGVQGAVLVSLME